MFVWNILTYFGPDGRRKNFKLSLLDLLAFPQVKMISGMNPGVNSAASLGPNLIAPQDPDPNFRDQDSESQNKFELLDPEFGN